MRVDYNTANQSLEVSLKVFTDDIEKSLEGMGAEKLRLGSPREFSASDSILTTYLNHRISFFVNDEQMAFSFVGKEVELDNTTWCYLEVENVPAMKQLTIRNKVLFELFEDQTNLVNVFVDEHKKSLLLRSSQPEDSITFE